MLAHVTLFCIRFVTFMFISQLLLAYVHPLPLTWNSSLVWCCLPRDAAVLHDHFFSAILVSLIGSCCWSPAILLLIQGCHVQGLFALRHMRPSIGQCWCLHNSAHKQLSYASVCQFVEHFLQSNVSHCLLFILHWLHLLTPSFFHDYFRDLWKFTQKCRKVLTEWLQFSSHICWLCFLGKNGGITFSIPSYFLKTAFKKKCSIVMYCTSCITHTPFL